MKNTSIFVVEDHSLTNLGIRQFFSEKSNFSCCGFASCDNLHCYKHNGRIIFLHGVLRPLLWNNGGRRVCTRLDLQGVLRNREYLCSGTDSGSFSSIHLFHDGQKCKEEAVHAANRDAYCICCLCIAVRHWICTHLPTLCYAARRSVQSLRSRTQIFWTIVLWCGLYRSEYYYFRCWVDIFIDSKCPD